MAAHKVGLKRPGFSYEALWMCGEQACLYPLDAHSTDLDAHFEPVDAAIERERRHREAAAAVSANSGDYDESDLEWEGVAADDAIDPAAKLDQLLKQPAPTLAGPSSSDHGFDVNTLFD
eukprot:tig00020830_g14501.t1